MRTPAAAAALCLCLCALVTGCIPTRRPVKAAPGRHAIAVAFVVDEIASRHVSAVPREVADEVSDALEERNLRVERAPDSAHLGAYRIKRLTQDRLAHLASRAPSDADLLLLLEAYPRFYSHLSGRYRWTVQYRVTLARKGALSSAITSDARVPVFLDYAHQREREALIASAPSLSRELGPLLDAFVSGLGGAGSSSGGERAAGGAPLHGAHRQASGRDAG